MIRPRNLGYIEGVTILKPASTNRGVGPKYYSELERALAEQAERNKPKDILETLAENPKLNYKPIHPENEARARYVEELAEKVRAEEAKRIAKEAPIAQLRAPLQ
jgi:hypothetical protein